LTLTEEYDILEVMKALSYSSLSKMGDCALRFDVERKLAERESMYSDKSVRGTIIHKFMEELINDSFLQGKWMGVTDAMDLMNVLWNEGFDTDNGKENILEVINWNTDFLEKSIKDSILLVPQIYEEILPLIKPIEVEAYRTIPLLVPGAEYTHLHGYIDVICESNSIIDWKTSTTVRREDMNEYDLQATVYHAISGMIRSNVHFIQFIFLKRDAPRIEWQTTKRDSRHTRWLMEKYLPLVVKQIDSGFLPPTPGWHCANCGVQCGVNPNIGEYRG